MSINKTFELKDYSCKIYVVDNFLFFTSKNGDEHHQVVIPLNRLDYPELTCVDNCIRFKLYLKERDKPIDLYWKNYTENYEDLTRLKPDLEEWSNVITALFPLERPEF